MRAMGKAEREAHLAGSRTAQPPRRCLRRRLHASPRGSNGYRPRGAGATRVWPLLDECWTLSSSASPSDASVCSLSDVLETGPHLSKYCLTPKAATGISAPGSPPRAGTPGGAPKGAGDAGAVVTTLQGGGKRGHRIDAEGCRRRPPNRVRHRPDHFGREPGQPAGRRPAPTLNGNGRVHVAPLPFRVGADESHGPLPFPARVSHALTSREGKGADSDATSGIVITPALAATLTSGIAASAGVNPPGRRQEDDFNLVTHALTSGGADASEDGTGRGTPLVPYERPVPSSLAVAGDFSTGEDVAQTVRSAHGQPGCVTAGLAVRRLTPLECERLQAFPAIERTLRIEVWNCSDRPKNPALAGGRNLKSQKSASNAGVAGSHNLAQPAGSHSQCSLPGPALPVAASVHIDCEASAAELRSPDGRRWSVNGAELKGSSPLAVLLDLSARLHALTPHEQVRATSTGRAASPPSPAPSTHQLNGAICVPVCGLEIDGSADDAHRCGLAGPSHSTFTTSRVGRSTQNSGLTWTTLCSSVLAAIGSLIPMPTPGATSYAVEITASAGWTRWKLVNGELVEQSDSARYRQLGNAVTVNVPEWIAHRLVAADLARGSEAGAA